MEFKSGEYEEFAKGSGKVVYRKWHSNFLNTLLGAEHKFSGSEDRTRPYFGFGYLLPLLIESDFSVDIKGGLSLALEKKFQWTKYFYTEVDAEFYYLVGKAVESDLEANLLYASRWDWAAGAVFNEDGVEAKVRYRF